MDRRDRGEPRDPEGETTLGVVDGWLDRGGHGAVDSLLLLVPTVEPDSYHLLLHGQLLRNHGNLFRAGFRVILKLLLQSQADVDLDSGPFLPLPVKH